MTRPLSHRRKFHGKRKIVHFDKEAAGYYAVIRSELERKGQIIGGNDIVIAATALANAGILVTHNVNEFSRINGLMLDDWTNN